MWPLVRLNRRATAALIFLLLVSLVALFAPILSPESFAGFEYHHGGAPPQLDWRYLLGADVYGHSIVAGIISGARTTWGVALLAALVALGLGSLISEGVGQGPSWLGAGVEFIAQGSLMVSFLPLVVVLAAFEGGGDPWAIGLLLGAVGTPYVVVMLSPDNPSDRKPRRAVGAFSLLQCRPSTSHGRWIRTATLLLGGFLVTSVTLDFLGFGLPASHPSWGNILSTDLDYLGGGYWWWTLFPGLAIILTLLAVLVLGQSLVESAEMSSEIDPSTARSAVAQQTAL